MKILFNNLAHNYEIPENKNFYTKTARILINLIQSYIDNPFYVLELGAGTGISTKEWLTYFPTSKVICIDKSLKMLTYINEKNLDVIKICIDAKEIVFKQKFDVIFGNICLHWFWDETFLCKLKKYLNYKGVIGFSVPVNARSFARGNLILSKILCKLGLYKKKTLREKILNRLRDVNGKHFEITFEETYSPSKWLKILKSRGSWNYLFDRKVKEAEELWKIYTKNLASLPLKWRIVFFLIKND